MIANLVPGAVLFLAGSFVFYALRGPIDFPRSAIGILLSLVAIAVLGHLARLAALALSWGAFQVFLADIFEEHAPLELVDELSPRSLSPELRERIARSVHEAFGVELPRLGRSSDETARDRTARALDEVLALARVRASLAAREHTAALESRVEGARGLAAALLLSAVLVLGTAVHDLFFAHQIAHAFSSFSIVAFGLGLGFAALASVGWARAQARRLALDLLLLLLPPAPPIPLGERASAGRLDRSAKTPDRPLTGLVPFPSTSS